MLRRVYLIFFIRKILKTFRLNLEFYKRKRYLKLIDFLKINLVFDIGANIGQFGLELINENYRNRIVSFEPTEKAHKQLRLLSKKYSNWHVHERVAIGSENKIVKINVAGNSAQSSSILKMSESHLDSAPNSGYVGKESVSEIKLDSIFKNYYKKGDEVLIKIDVQGYEDQVLKGAIESLKDIRAIKLECSLLSLYEGDKIYKYYFDFLENQGFTLFDIETGHFHPKSGRLLQFDAFFVKENF